MTRLKARTSEADDIILPGTVVFHETYGEGTALERTPILPDILTLVRWNNGNEMAIISRYLTLEDQEPATDDDEDDQ